MTINRMGKNLEQSHNGILDYSENRWITVLWNHMNEFLKSAEWHIIKLFFKSKEMVNRFQKGSTYVGKVEEWDQVGSHTHWSHTINDALFFFFFCFITCISMYQMLHN